MRVPGGAGDRRARGVPGRRARVAEGNERRGDGGVPCGHDARQVPARVEPSPAIPPMPGGRIRISPVARRHAGGKKDRNRFQPHISLYRGCKQAPAAPAVAPDFSLSYDHLTLFESRQGRRGVSYHPVAEWPLRTPSA